MNDDEQIKILLEEYKSLRSEILLRLNHRIGFIGLTIALLGASFFKDDPSTTQMMLIAFAVLSMFFIWMQIGNLVAQAARRVAEIEKKINTLAGDELLCWESKTMAGEFFRRIHRF